MQFLFVSSPDVMFSVEFMLRASSISTFPFNSKLIGLPFSSWFSESETTSHQSLQDPRGDQPNHKIDQDMMPPVLPKSDPKAVHNVELKVKSQKERVCLDITSNIAASDV